MSFASGSADDRPPRSSSAPLVAVVREEEVALENRGSELALVSTQANRKSDEGRCIMQRDSPSVDVSDEKKPATVRFSLQVLEK